MKRLRPILLVALASATLVACHRDEKKPGSNPTGAAKPVPPGPYVVRYDCFHSDQPFGPRNYVRNASWDLGAKTVTRLVYEYSSEPSPQLPDTAPPAPIVSPLPADKAASIEAAVVAVLRGGPFKPEVAVHEGTPCMLVIGAGGVEIFKLDKARTTEKDAATDLVQALSR